MIPITNLTGRLGNQMFQLAYLYAEVKRGNIPDIYVQDPQFFEGCEEEIKAIFRQGIEPLDQVAIHIRRGKNPAMPSEPAYSENPFYVNLMDTTYYEDAMALFPDADFLIFSDDIKWCKDTFGHYHKNIRYSEGKTDVEDFNLMAGCKGIIMANSSYSWWAAYIAPYAEKIVRPEKWYTDGVDRTVCPSHWLVV